MSLKILVVVLMVVYGANANSAGAPAAACGTLTPGHGGNSQPDPPPFFVDLSPFYVNGSYIYTPGRTYIVTLNGTANFRGFFVQTRMVSDDMTRVGVFAVATGQNNTRLSSCPTDTDGITHVNNVQPRIEFTQVNFNWTAPPAGTGQIRFAYAAVQVFDTWWSNRRSAMLSEEGAAVVTPTPTPTPSSGKELAAISVVTILMSVVPLLQF